MSEGAAPDKFDSYSLFYSPDTPYRPLRRKPYARGDFGYAQPLGAAGLSAKPLCACRLYRRLPASLIVCTQFAREFDDQDGILCR